MQDLTLPIYIFFTVVVYFFLKIIQQATVRPFSVTINLILYRENKEARAQDDNAGSNPGLAKITEERPLCCILSYPIQPTWIVPLPNEKASICILKECEWVGWNPWTQTPISNVMVSEERKCIFFVALLFQVTTIRQHYQIKFDGSNTMSALA